MPRILLVGHGRMGGALIAGWDKKQFQLAIIDPHHAGAYPELAALPKEWQPDLVLFAVKPQTLPALLPEYAARFGDAPLYLSIAAGKSTAFFAEHFGQARIIRAMPNTPAMIGQGATVCFANAHATPQDKQLAETLLAPTGLVRWLEDEALLHAVTALSGSGPAYVFLFLEALVEAGIAQGLPEALAKELALQTVSGSAALAAQSGQAFAALCEHVTSPGGTTQAALTVLTQKDALKRLMADALEAATQRSWEL